jgi:hypothetical protein
MKDMNISFCLQLAKTLFEYLSDFPGSKGQTLSSIYGTFELYIWTQCTEANLTTIYMGYLVQGELAKVLKYKFGQTKII